MDATCCHCPLSHEARRNSSLLLHSPAPLPPPPPLPATDIAAAAASDSPAPASAASPAAGVGAAACATAGAAGAVGLLRLLISRTNSSISAPTSSISRHRFSLASATITTSTTSLATTATWPLPPRHVAAPDWSTKRSSARASSGRLQRARAAASNNTTCASLFKARVGILLSQPKEGSSHTEVSSSHPATTGHAIIHSSMATAPSTTPTSPNASIRAQPEA
ncbi:unnamed protein product [Closterium sp. NIES-53]